MDDENVLANCNNQRKLLNKEGNKLCEKYPEVYRELRGTGMFQGLEIYGNTH